MSTILVSEKKGLWRVYFQVCRRTVFHVLPSIILNTTRHARRIEMVLETSREVPWKKEKSKNTKSFTCRASHYGRRGAPGRKYLPSDLSVMKMHKMFRQQNHVDTSYALYYSVFHTRFNLGFGHPVTDACAECMNYKLSCADLEATDEVKRTKAAMFILHRRRARIF
jgi:hypothetical protein